MLTDEKILKLCRIYGERTKYYRQKFIGLLPEVYKRKLYEKAGCSSVFEFGKKFAGLSEQQVNRALNLERRFQDKPDLHRALVNGEVSVNKLARIVSIATAENQKILLEQIKNLPNRAVETLVRDEKNVHVHKSDEQSTMLQEPEPEPKLSDEVKRKLNELQAKGIDINELIFNAISQREQEISEEKEALALEQNFRNSESKKASRYIPRKIEKLIQKEYGSKCAMPNCHREAEQIHHEIPFALLQNHNPYFLKPLCKEHHIIIHNIHLAYERMRKVRT